MREGIFNEEDLNALENGYSVSETDGSQINENDIISLRSGLSGGIALSSPVQDRQEQHIYEKNISVHPGIDLENQIRHQEQ